VFKSPTMLRLFSSFMALAWFMGELPLRGTGQRGKLIFQNQGMNGLIFKAMHQELESRSMVGDLNTSRSSGLEKVVPDTTSTPKKSCVIPSC